MCLRFSNLDVVLQMNDAVLYLPSGMNKQLKYLKQVFTLEESDF